MNTNRGKATIGIGIVAAIILASVFAAAAMTSSDGLRDLLIEEPAQGIILQEDLVERFGLENIPSYMESGALNGIMAVYTIEDRDAGIARLWVNNYGSPADAMLAYEGIKQRVTDTANVGSRNRLPFCILQDDIHILMYCHGPATFAVWQNGNILFTMRSFGMSVKEMDSIVYSYADSGS